MHEIQEYGRKKHAKGKDCLLIVKPDCGSQGKGIFIVKSVQELKCRVDQTLKKQKQAFKQYLKAEECYNTVQRYGAG
jgi:biotin carboxylase